MTVIEATETDFQREVIDRSHTTPVVVDFWAPWCGPCKQLTPLLEQLAGDAEGAVVLAKINVDDNPALSQSHGVQSIPTVKAFVDGVVVDEFIGAPTAESVREFFARLNPSQADILVASGDEEQLRQALELEPGHTDASLALAVLLQERGDDEQALEVLAQVTGNFRADGFAARIRIGEDPQLDLGPALTALEEDRVPAALDILMDRVERFPAQREDLRLMVVGILDELGAEHPLARDTRRRLAAALY